MFNLSDVKALVEQGEKQRILSLYLNVDNAQPENQAANPAWRIWLKKQLRSVEAQLKEEDQPAWDAVRDSVDTFFMGYMPSGKGLVAFFSPDWQQTHSLPVPLDNQAAFGRPLVGPMLLALDEYRPYLVVLVDQEEAHFYVSYLGQTAFRDSIEIDLDEYDFGEKTGMPSTSATAGGHGGVMVKQRDTFEDMIHEHRMRFYREVAAHTHHLMQHEGIERVILGGDEQAGHSVRRQMSEPLQSRVVDVVSIPRHYSLHDLFAQVQPLALEYERREDTRIVEEVIDRAHAGGRAVLGVEAVETALRRQQVSELIVAWPPQSMGRVNDLAYRALQLNSAITMVHGTAADRLRAESGGVAARLYYTL